MKLSKEICWKCKFKEEDVFNREWDDDREVKCPVVKYPVSVDYVGFIEFLLRDKCPFYLEHVLNKENEGEAMKVD